ncbi:MAG TPA: GNAT family N-acetyltransferase [Pseudolabrys sp.]|nr:GNAT family N-acetyltransferase [Pseudolabrys sp.]
MVEIDAVTIREAEKRDLPGVLALYAQPDLDDGKVLPAIDAERIFDRFARYPDYTLYVAELDSRIVGTFALLIMDNLGHLGAPSAVVEDVAVGPSLHSRGVGRAMMGFAMERAKEKHCYKIVLSSNARRERAHAFYENIGFERHGYSFRVVFSEASA